MSPISKIEVECAAIQQGQLTALLEVLLRYAETATDGNIFTDALAGCMSMAADIRESLDKIVDGGQR